MIAITLLQRMGFRSFNERADAERADAVTSHKCYQIGLGCTKAQGCNVDNQSHYGKPTQFPREYLENIW